ncbi:MAG: ABC transporter ATP-binding protein/permease [Acidobacteriia bacterium]|nr:ABC transporter ATP-binding protein/permease [Terriglobia bacterium]
MLRLIRNLIRPYRKSLAIVLAAMLMETLMSLATPWPLKVVLDNVVGGNRLPHWLNGFLGTLPGRGQTQLALLAAVGFVAMAAIGAVASYIDSYVSESVSQGVAHDLRMRTYHHLQRLSLAYYDHHKVGASLSTLTSDIDTIQNFASSGTLGILVDILAVFGMFLLMFWLNWVFALLAAVVAPFLLWFVSRYRKALKNATKLVRGNESEMVAVEIHGLESQRIVEAFGAQELEEARLNRVSQATLQSALHARKIKAFLSPAVAVTVAASTAFVLWRGAGLVVAGTMTAGDLVVFLSYLSRFFKPVQDLAKMTNAIAQVAVAAERVQAILETDQVIPELPNARPADFPRGEIAFNHVAFEYVPGSRVLADVTFRISPGQFVGVVGPTGSGKSTIASLIPRFYDPGGGAITIDGVDIREFQLQSLRQHFGFVLQDTVLFRGTVAENISYGRPTAAAREIAEAAQLANAHEFIQQMPEGYQTVIGERGMTLSGGQRQRIGIARAFIRNSPVLILDEPTAALDVESEERVMEGLMRLMQGKTVIMIAHRLATLQAADKIVVLKNGVVAEEGGHQTLLSLGGIYAGLHNAQSDTKTVEAAV